jgi:hypothetical protein
MGLGPLSICFAFVATVALPKPAPRRVDGRAGAGASKASAAEAYGSVVALARVGASLLS